MHLDGQALDLVTRILAFWAPGIPAYAYGSRVHGHQLKPFSDLDICLRGAAPIDADTLTDLRDAFANSRLPIRVDVVDWHALSDEFRGQIAPDLVPLPQDKLSGTASC